MNIANLIQELQKYPLDMIVLVRGYEYGTTILTPELIRETFVMFDENKDDHSYGGEHGDATDDITFYPKDTKLTKVLFLDRTED